MAKFWTMVSNMFREKRDAAAQSLADPIRDGKFAIEDSKKQIREYTSQVARLRAETIMQKQEMADALAEQKKYEAIAKKAGDAGHEEDVVSAVNQIQKWTARVTELKTQIAKSEKVETNLRQQLDIARTKVARAEQNHQTLAARQKGAEIRKSLAMASQQFADGQSGLAALDDLEKAVKQEEAEAEAMEEVAAPAVETDLSAKYGSSSVDTEDMVAKYLKKPKKVTAKT